jgi:SWI/SNF-related matrix-associated actin-dependent regulator of chromatin subfamily A member 5
MAIPISPQTPRRRSASALLLEVFSARSSPSSPSQARKEAFSLPTSPLGFGTGDDQGIGIVVSRPGTSYSQNSSCVTNDDEGTSEKQTKPRHVDTVDIGDMIVVSETKPKQPTAISNHALLSETKESTRTLRPRSEVISESLSKRTARKAHVKKYPKILKGKHKSENKLLPSLEIVTGRKRIRQQIASGTKIQRDNFYLAHKDYFLPLLPANNYIRKLEASSGGIKPNAVQFVPLTEQPKG